MKASTKKLLVGFGIGCSVLIVLAIGAMVAVGYFAKKSFDEMAEGMKNPGPAAQKALGAEELPPNFEAVFSFKIPFIAHMTILKELQPGEQPAPAVEQGPTQDGELKEPDMPKNGLIYFNVIRMKEAGDIRSYIKGETTEEASFNDAGMNLNVQRELGRGHFQVGDTTYSYFNHVGEFELNDAPTNSSGQTLALASMILAECPSDDRVRIFYWFTSAPDLDTQSGEPMDLTGTGKVGDPERMQSIMEYFNICQ